MPMPPSLDALPIDVRVGGRLSALDTRPLPPCAPQVLAFLGELSQHLLASPAARTYPDVAAFAYWCRPANLRRVAASQGEGGSAGGTRLGRGLALHIAPANVPVNFAFSLVFGMLAGNANVVRLSETRHAQADVICAALTQLLQAPAHRRLAEMTRVIAYPRNDEVTAALSALCHVRVLWGGDQTIAHLRRLPIPARCVEVAFADRYSMCILGAQAVCDADTGTLAQLVQGFHNDTYTLDQNACSSPQLVIWQGEGERIQQAQQRFWPALAELVRQRDGLSAVAAVDKFSQLCSMAMAQPQALVAQRHGNFVYRIPFGELPADIDQHRGRHGVFSEYGANDLACLATVVAEKYQTVTCFGVERQSVVEAIVDAGLPGVDRVVPVGRALDIGVVWDGYDLIGTMSRVIADV